ncbi:MAG TPA: thiamine pyrophosphate-dependent enzyme [Longimicrobium sp.]|nr:thiamine pyrophosphate-dependent enzyme [Longimicrobium sp.]
MAKSNANPSYTVSDYLAERLREFGAEHVFAVPGDYAGAFLSRIDQTKTVTRVGVTNEWVAGYAADAYARLRGAGCACLTYGVGTFGVLNCLAGSYVEEAAVALIIGSPARNQRVTERHEGVLFHHSTGKFTADVESVKNVTVAREVISDARNAAKQIDRALAEALAWKRPCYIEVFANVWNEAAKPPKKPLQAAKLPVSRRAVERAVDRTLERFDRALREPDEKLHPVIWAGVEVQRFGLQSVLEEIIAVTGLPWASDLCGKSVLSEDHPGFLGTFDGASAVHDVMELFDASKCVLGLGALVTDDFAIWVAGDGKSSPPHYDNMVLAFGNAVRVSRQRFDEVPLDAFMRRLLEKLKARNAPVLAAAAEDDGALTGLRAGRKSRRLALAKAESAAEEEQVTYTRFFERVAKWNDASMVLLADTSIALYSAAELKIARANGFIAQAAWNSIGFTPGAAVGVGYAEPGKKAVVFCGDGGFQEIVQAVSDIVRSGHDAVVFVFNNALYGIEQAFVNYKFFTAGEPPEEFDLLHAWDYARLVEVFNGGWGATVSTMDELDAALKQAKKNKGLSLIDVRVPEKSITVQMLQQAGADPVSALGAVKARLATTAAVAAAAPKAGTKGKKPAKATSA